MPPFFRTLTTIALTSFLSACATTNYDKSEVCSGAPSGKGKQYVITDAGDGYLSRSKDNWPWDGLDLPENTILSLQCVMPSRPTSQPEQRRAVYEIEGTQNLIFGTTSTDGTPNGVLAYEDFKRAKSLEGNSIWFTGSVRHGVSEAKNLERYTVKRITQPTIMSGSDLLMIVQVEGAEMKVPLFWDDQSEEFGIPRGSFFESEPTSDQLKVSGAEIPLIKEGIVEIGMTQNAVYHSLGFPKDINYSQFRNRKVEQWVYRDTRTLVYFDDSKTVFHIQRGY